MNKDHPFDEQEIKVMELLITAHNEYCKLNPLYPSEQTDWMNRFHSLQELLITRTAVRNYPDYFYSTP